ncbi:Intraflagellar transport protein, partial [Paragonimus heterotremus]
VVSFNSYYTNVTLNQRILHSVLTNQPPLFESQNMARMCVNTRRLDVARLCLGKMGNPMAALMVREAKVREPEPEAHAGELAIQLGMPDEAERLFTQCGRWDLVIRLHQSLGQWDKALRVAASHNRIALRSTHYAYAKELESMGKVEQAIEHYIQSETYRFEVPRMLKSSPDMLEDFVNQQQDKSVYRWWAQTLEAQGKLDEARTYYVQAKDYLSLVRVLCCLGRNEDAETLCNETGDPAACYHLARQMEANGGIEQAIRLFTRAKAYSSAVRLCKEHNRNDHLYSLAQLGRVEDMLEAATHLESVPAYANKAVLLFHKAGHIGRAVELAFQTRQYAALQTVASSLDDKIDPTLLRRCAEFFTQNNQFDRAVDVLAAGKQAEIEDFGSYEKATGALTEAYKVLLKAINSTTTNEATELRLQKRLTQIKNKATMCKEFAQTQLLFSVDPLEAMRNCQTLLENTEPGDILRPGDIYAAMIREFVSKGKYQAALACMQEMRERLNGSNQSIMQYIDRNTLETIHRAINVPMPEEAKESESKQNGNGITELIESPVSEDDILDASVSNGSDDGY